MLRYLTRRLLHMIPLLLGITFLAFLVIGLAPGDYFSALRMNPSISPQLITELERQFGYGDPLVLRYFK
jgi:peptide/nickel transport system permease protein